MSALIDYKKNKETNSKYTQQKRVGGQDRSEVPQEALLTGLGI